MALGDGVDARAIPVRILVRQDRDTEGSGSAGRIPDSGSISSGFRSMSNQIRISALGMTPTTHAPPSSIDPALAAGIGGWSCHLPGPRPLSPALIRARYARCGSVVLEHHISEAECQHFQLHLRQHARTAGPVGSDDAISPSAFEDGAG